MEVLGLVDRVGEWRRGAREGAEEGGTGVAPRGGMTHHDLAELFDGALSAARTQQASRACELMREVLERTSSLPPDAVVEGSEELPAGFYFNSAQAFLTIHCYSVIE